MKYVRCLVAVFSLFFISADLSHANIFGDFKNIITEGAGEITDLGEGQFDIAAVAPLSQNRAATLQKWKSLASQACGGGEYKTLERRFNSYEHLTLEGVVECKRNSRPKIAPQTVAHSLTPTSNNQSTPKYHSNKSNNTSSENNHFINMIRSPNPDDVRAAAQKIYRERIFDSALLQSVNDVLLSGYTFNKGSMHIDAMAWLCKVLGASGQQEYMSTLNEVAMNGVTGKLKKYAASSM